MASQAGAHLPSGEGNNLAASQTTQAGRQAASQAGVHLPPGEGRNSAITQVIPPLLVTVLPPRQAVRPPHIPLLGKVLSKQATTSPQVRQAVKLLGQAGKTPGIQPGKGPSRLPRGTALPPGQTVLVPRKATSHLIPQIGFPKGLPQKTPSQSGSLTYPTNL